MGKEYTENELALFDIVLSQGNTADIRNIISKLGKEKCDAMFYKLTGQHPAAE